jgi:protein involved in polysaccharide export with SLBB domain
MRKRQILTSLSLMAGMATGGAWAQGGPAPDNVPTKAPYVIGLEDVIGVRVFRDTDFSGAYTVRPDGKIILPLVGPIEAVGQTTQQLAARIREALSAYTNKPDVGVFLQRVAAKPIPSPAK